MKLFFFWRFESHHYFNGFSSSFSPTKFFFGWDQDV